LKEVLVRVVRAELSLEVEGRVGFHHLVDRSHLEGVLHPLLCSAVVYIQ